MWLMGENRTKRQQKWFLSIKNLDPSYTEENQELDVLKTDPLQKYEDQAREEKFRMEEK